MNSHKSLKIRFLQKQICFTLNSSKHTDGFLWRDQRVAPVSASGGAELTEEVENSRTEEETHWLIGVCGDRSIQANLQGMTGAAVATTRCHTLHMMLDVASAVT